MKLSIIIPVYNLEDHIGKCLDSILSHNFSDFEIIVIDDGSSDNSLSICRSYSQKDSRIIVLQQPNAGVSIARNVGINSAKGEYLCFIDGDDWISENSLNAVLNAQKANDLDIIVARAFAHDGNRRGVERYAFKPSLTQKVYSGTDVVIKEGYIRGSVWAVFFKRELILENDILFAPKLKNGEDTLFFTLCLIKAAKVGFYNVAHYYVLEREGSASRAWDFDRVVLTVDSIVLINQYIADNPNLSEDALSLLHYNIYRVISTAFNALSKCFSIKRFISLTKRINKELRGNIRSGKIAKSKGKIALANLSISLFGLSVLLGNALSKRRK